MAGTFRKRGRPRKIDANASEVRAAVQDISFPTIDDPATIPAEENIRTDAEQKRRVAAAAKEIPDIFEPEQVEWVFNIYVSILCFVYSIILKVDIELLAEELKFTPEETALMAKPLAKICSKYAPAEWAGMSAEIQLITSLGVWTVMSFKRAQKVVEKEEEKKRDRTRTRAVDPMPRPMREEHVPA